jgi:uncharacterized membrane protein
MVTVEKATRDELAALSEPVRASATAAAALELARRLDSEPADSVAVLLARELRLAMNDLHRQGGEVNGELESFLAGIANPAFRGPGD